MEDYLLRSIAREAGVRALACATTNLVEEARVRHDLAPTATAALGRALTTGVLLGALLKVRQRVALKFEGSGPLRKILVEAGSYGTVRGYVAEPTIDLPLVGGRQDVVSAIGRAGLLTVVKDLHLKELAESIVPLATSEIDSDVAAYLEQSEQIPSAVEVGVTLNADGSVALAAGLLVQSIPPYNEMVMEQIKERLQELPPIEDLLKDVGTPEGVLQAVFAETEYEVLEQRPLTFTCSCSRARAEKALVTLGTAELHHLLSSEGQAVVDCPFCHERYVFTGDELEDLIARIEGE